MQIGVAKKGRGCVGSVARSAIVPLANKSNPEKRSALVNCLGHETTGNVRFALILLIARMSVGHVELHVAIVSA